MGKAGWIIVSVYPPLYFYPGYNVLGYLGIPTTTLTMLQTSPASAGPLASASFQAVVPCTCVAMTISANGVNSTAGNIRFQPWGALTGGVGGLLGTPINGPIIGSGPFLTYVMPQNFSLSPGGYVGISMTGSGTNCQIWAGGTLWFTQTRPI